MYCTLEYSKCAKGRALIKAQVKYGIPACLHQLLRKNVDGDKLKTS